MHEQNPRQVPLIERISRWVPGYGGYLERGSRRSDDQLLRDAIAARLAKVKPAIEAAIRDRIDRGALAELGPLEQSLRHVDRLADRLRHAGSGTDAFYSGQFARANWAESLHGSDMTLFEKVDALVAASTAPPSGAGLAEALKAPLDDLDRALDLRAEAIQGIR
jgi:hypothetical protein